MHTIPSLTFDDVRRTLDSIPAPAFIIDTTGVLRWLNRTGREVLGDKRGKPAETVIAPAERQRAKEKLREKFLTGKPTRYTTTFLGADGQHHIAEAASTPMFDEHGKITGVLGVATLRDCPNRPVEPHLTPRQLAVLDRLEQGRSTAEIADELGVTRETIRKHISALLRAYGARSRLELLARRLSTAALLLNLPHLG